MQIVCVCKDFRPDGIEMNVRQAFIERTGEEPFEFAKTVYAVRIICICGDSVEIEVSSDPGGMANLKNNTIPRIDPKEMLP